MRARTCSALLVAVLAAPATAAADVSGPDIVRFLNDQRAANGVPAGIVEDPALSSGCAKHNAYGAQNDTLEHSEEPGKPGYSPEGHEAAQTSVLYAGGGPWSARTNPFETAPIHLHQLLHPRLDRMGASENGGYGCATTLASRERPAPAADVTYTYPGDGVTGWVTAQEAAESPYTPGERLGIPAGTTTGPYLYVMFDGPDFTGYDAASGSRATLTGPGGAVPVVTADNSTDGLEGYLPPGAQVIPRTPLAPGTKYTATVDATVIERPFSHQWTFTTADGPLPYKAKARRKGTKILVTVKATSDLEAQVRVGGIKTRKAVKAGTTFKKRFAAPASPVKVRVVITMAGGRWVVKDKR